MEISLKRSSYGCDLIFVADNVKVTENIDDRIYGKKEDGTLDFHKVTRDINTDVLGQFASVLGEMIYYRNADFDSSDLIESLFEKLPEEAVDKLLSKLTEDYQGDIE